MAAAATALKTPRSSPRKSSPRKMAGEVPLQKDVKEEEEEKQKEERAAEKEQKNPLRIMYASLHDIWSYRTCPNFLSPSKISGSRDPRRRLGDCADPAFSFPPRRRAYEPNLQPAKTATRLSSPPLRSPSTAVTGNTSRTCISSRGIRKSISMNGCIPSIEKG